MSMWFYQYQDREVGPLTRSEILQRWHAGGLEATTLVRQDESAEWLPLADWLARDSAIPEKPSAPTPTQPLTSMAFVSLSSLTQAMVTLMLLGAVLMGIRALLEFLDRPRLQALIAQGVVYVEGGLRQPDTVQVLSGLISVLLLLCTLAAFLVAGRWIYQAAHNVRALGAKGLDISPAWSVGWYFVPFANLIMPYRAMQQIARASVDARAWHLAKTTSLLPFWWLLWLGSNLWQHLCSRALLAAESYQALLEANGCSLYGTPASIALNLVFAGMLWQIYVAQERQASTQLNQGSPVLDKAI